MGAYQSKRRDFPPPKKRKLRKPVYDYLPTSSRRRPRSSHSWRDVVMVTLGQMGKSSTSYEEFETEAEKEQHLPKWQSKWEVDMRPVPISENRNNLRGWRSMPIPTTAEESTANKATPKLKLTTSRRGANKKLSRNRRFEPRESVSPLTEVEETDNFERYSYKSSKVDDFKMLHKSDDKTVGTLRHACRMWQQDRKKSTKTWFLGQDAHARHENQIVEKKTHVVNTRNVFVATKSQGRWAREAPAQLESF